MPFTPSHSEEDLPPPSYRGCWHGVSRGFFLESCHDRALDERALQAALPFFTHAILLDRAFAHCPRFPTAAPRGSPGRVSVPVWLIIRKDQLSIIGLVSLYLTNYLILRGLIGQRLLHMQGAALPPYWRLLKPPQQNSFHYISFNTPPLAPTI